MPEVVIDRCTVRVVRRGGWSWGRDPKRLLEDVIRALPGLLARALEGCCEEEEERSWEAPIRIRLRLSQSELGQVWTEEAREGAARASSPAAPLERRIEAALLPTLGTGKNSAGKLQGDRKLVERFCMKRCGGGRVTGRSASLQKVLLSLRSEGVLEQFLAEFSEAELDVWHGALRRQVAAERAESGPRAEEMASELEEVLEGGETPQRFDGAQVLRRRLFAVIEISARLGIPLDDAGLWEVLDKVLPLEGAAGSLSHPRGNLEAAVLPEKEAAHAATAALSRVSSPATWGEREGPGGSVPAEWSTQVASALPFLLLGPLAQMGYFSLLTATLEAAHLEDRAALFAAGLAYKVLDPPERGWRRSASAQHSAAVFAGCTGSFPEGVVTDFSRQIAQHTGPLDRLLAKAVLSGRPGDAPVLLSRADSGASSGFLLLDVRGCFPIGWFSQAPSVALALEAIRPRAVLVAAEAAGPKMLRELDRSGIAFVTGVPPTREELWRPMRRGAVRLGWTNHSSPDEEFLLRAAAELDPASEEATTLWKELGVDRIAAPRSAWPEFDRSLFYAAGAALGIVSWRLWSERGRTSPQLALERLGDLDAHVHVSDKSVTVRVPLGRRQSELLECGLLSPVEEVPWLEGRRVEFGWG